MQEIRVVLPAPFGPSRPKNSPSAISSETCCKACTGRRARLNALETWRTETAEIATRSNHPEQRLQTVEIVQGTQRWRGMMHSHRRTMCHAIERCDRLEQPRHFLMRHITPDHQAPSLVPNLNLGHVPSLEAMIRRPW